MKNVVKSHCHCKKSTLAWVNHVQIVLRTRCHVKTYSRHLSQTLQTNQNKDNFFYTNQKKKVIIIQTIRTKVRWSQPSLNDDLCGPIRTKTKLIDQSERFITAESKWSVNITILSKFSQPSPNDHLISQFCHTVYSCQHCQAPNSRTSVTTVTTRPLRFHQLSTIITSSAVS